MPPSSVRSFNRSDCRQISATSATGSPHGGGGIGREIALALGREGCAVAVAARTPDEVAATADELRRLGVEAAALDLDVSDADAIARVAGAVTTALGPVEILVNNAGLAESAPFAKTDGALWDRHLRINATGPYLLSRALLPAMLASGWGRVINIASVAGLRGAPYVTAYTASKHALVGLTRALAGQVAKDREGRVVGKGDLVAQFRQVCENLKAAVTAGGGQLTDVVKLTIYVLDAGDYKRHAKAIGDVYREYFGKHFPAMTLVGVRDLYDAAEGCVIEIEGFACLP